MNVPFASKKAIHQRRSIRLKGYDYTQAGSYFITICTQSRECLFGEIANGKMGLNKFGKIARDEWLVTAELRNYIELGEWVVMPNHFHGIIMIVNDEGGMAHPGTARRAPTGMVDGGGFGKSVAGSIATIVRSYKSAVTKRINEMRGIPGGVVWQRNYWEHIIRDEKSFAIISEYILNNAQKWEEDQLYSM
jgi:putative transposase